MNAPRFSFPEPRPQSAGDKLLGAASKLSIEIHRFNGRLSAQVEMRSQVCECGLGECGGDEDDDALLDRDDIEKREADALALIGQVLRAFAAGKDGAA